MVDGEQTCVAWYLKPRWPIVYAVCHAIGVRTECG